MMKKKVLVLGKNGRLGKALTCLARKELSIQLYSLGKQECNVLVPAQVERVVRRIQPTYVINATGYTDVMKARKEKRCAWLLNVQAVENIVRVCSQQEVPLIQMSSDYVFSGDGARPWHAFSMQQPLGYYAQTKTRAETCFLQECQKGVLIRAGWFHQGISDFVTKILDQIYQDNLFLSVTKEQVGTPTYIPRLAAWILRGINQRKERTTVDIVHYQEAGRYVSRFVWTQYILACAMHWGENFDQKEWALSCRQALDNINDQYVLSSIQPKNCRLYNDRVDHWSTRSLPHWKIGTQKSVAQYCASHF